MIAQLKESQIQGKGFGLSELVSKQPNMFYSKEGSAQNLSRETTSLLEEQTMYGRENKKKDIIQKLLKDEPSNENCVVISIVGTGGIGKTTLARNLYNDHQLDAHFKSKAWVCVSDQVFDVTRVTTNLFKSATGKNIEFNNLESAQHNLSEAVKEQRSLIVLDDVWTENSSDWNQLKIPFQRCARGSKVIVTTRNHRVAKMMCKNPNDAIMKMEKLSEEHCWIIFSKRLNPNVDNDLSELQTTIIEKCDGLPLAAKALGDLFNIKTSMSERKSLLYDNIWSEEGQVLPVLRLSYFHLPTHLKPVFAYCSMFPADYEFKETDIILLWMAQGLLPLKHSEKIEVTGHHYFLELVSRSLFERSPSKKECYIMHDLVHELSRWAAGGICCCVTKTRDMQRDMPRTRHLNLYSNVETEVIQAKVDHRLRTFICLNTLEIKDFISRFRCVRTLILASETIENLPECIGDLKHMRYLKLDFKK